MKFNTLDWELQSENNNLLVKKIQQNANNKKINISASKNDGSHPYHSLNWLVTVP